MGEDRQGERAGEGGARLTGGIARVYVEAGLPHLDRLFDYAIPPDLAATARPGVRVKVPFSGRRLAGYIVELADATTAPKLSPLAAVVSDQVVLPPASVRLIRAVADHTAGTFVDVARLAIPPRVAAVEQSMAAAPEGPPPPAADVPLTPGPVDHYPTGTLLRQALRAGRSPRASWTVAPVVGDLGDWAGGLASLAADTVAGGRSALVLAPDATACAALLAAIRDQLPGVAVAWLTAAQGARARYRNFLLAASGAARVLVGTRAAAYAPMPDLGLIAVWDEADGPFAEPRTPYPSVRDVVAIRARQDNTALVFAAHAPSVEVTAWGLRGWLTPLALPLATVRAKAAVVRVASSEDEALDQDAHARSARLPHDVFDLVHRGLESGAVLVWVPWADEAVTTADQLAQAFRRTRVRRVDATQPERETITERCIVVATPGSAPPAEGGYAAAVILDADAFLSRAHLRAGEQAVRRWLDVVADVQRADSATVLLVGQPSHRAVQAVLRLDPNGFAEAEWADRVAAGLPPATRVAVFTGDAAPVVDVAQAATTAGWDALGPMPAPDEEDQVIVRAPVERGGEFAAWLHEQAAARVAARRAGKLSWRLDPIDWG